MGMLTTAILGTGALARSLFEAIQQEQTIQCVGVHGRNEGDASFFGSYWKSDPKELFEAELLLVALPDHALHQQFSSLDSYKGILTHCSGATAIQPRTTYPSAVCYPLNSFNKSQRTSLKATPLFVEASNPQALKRLRFFAESLSEQVVELESPRRLALHLAAVISQNFSNHLLAQTQQWCSENSLDFLWLKPMLESKFNEAFLTNAALIQSGPALRRDEKTLAQHRVLLSEHVSLLQIYNALTTSIQEFHEKEF